MATIKPIEGRSVHQIQSGQVIVDLNSVAKELVENALDAGATTIEVRFKNNGLDSIEVQDNGSGIAPEDFDTIALKHYTSKLATYDDLGSLQTFGFRGEALSSLCALSKFHIITARASDGPRGTKLEFEPSGKIKGTSVVAAKQGTTVVVESLFHNLPVRRKELEKTIKREYTKVLSLLHAYACISVGVKFSVSNQMPKGKKTVAFATHANPNTKENIANVYGAKTLQALIDLDLRFEMDPSATPSATQSARNWSTQEDPGSRGVRILGHISRPVVGEGRQTPDRQMFFVNSRPCTLPQVAKAFNEVYKSFNITQSPFIFADIRLDTNAYDVNVSPDKRTILLHDQTALLESLKTALAELFEAQDQSVPQARLLDRKLPAFKPPAIRQQESTVSTAGRDSASPDPVASSEAQRGDDELGTPPSPSAAVPRPGFIKASLIERFAGRDTEDRTDQHPVPRRKISSMGKRELPFLQDEGEEEPDTELPIERDESPLFEPEGEPDERLPQLPKAVQDFNARLASQSSKHSPHNGAQITEDEESIPAVMHTPQTRLSQSTIQNAFDRMRPMRTPVQQATITVGNTTTVSTIGTGTSGRATKRARVHTPKFSLNGTPLSQATQKPVYKKSLRGFVAPGTQLDKSDDDAEGTDTREEDDDPDSSMPDAPLARSPSPTKRDVSKELIGPSSDETELGEYSSMPLAIPRSPAPEEERNEESEPQEVDYNSSEDEYIDEAEKKAREDAKVARMIAEAEEAAARPTESNIKRARRLLKLSQKKYQTLNLAREVEISVNAISSQLRNLQEALQASTDTTLGANAPRTSQLPTTLDAEERLTLTVSKSDFAAMRIIGQFNQGFILAVRPPSSTSPTPDLFIIDQHASDEKYNFERFSATTIMTSQKLVHPHPLHLTAIEEETILNNEHALTANGFAVAVDTSGSSQVGQRAKLVSLPMSNSATFTPADFEELLTLLEEHSTSTSSSSAMVTQQQYIPRPSKVRKLLASRACRSSIMIGKTLNYKQMDRVVRHMGEMDKPWSCPHGRPTMRHLFGLEKWESWGEGDGVGGLAPSEGKTDWGAYLESRRG